MFKVLKTPALSGKNADFTMEIASLKTGILTASMIAEIPTLESLILFLNVNLM